MIDYATLPKAGLFVMEKNVTEKFSQQIPFRVQQIIIIYYYLAVLKHTHPAKKHNCWIEKQSTLHVQSTSRQAAEQLLR
jgi:hypothetical protein